MQIYFISTLDTYRHTIAMGCTQAIVATIEAGFYRWGKLIARQPWIGVLVPIILTAVLIPVGIFCFEFEVVCLRLKIFSPVC